MRYKLSRYVKVIRNRGVYIDRSSKGDGKHHHIWRADVTVNGLRLRKRFAHREEAKEWLRRICV